MSLPTTTRAMARRADGTSALRLSSPADEPPEKNFLIGELCLLAHRAYGMDLSIYKTTFLDKALAKRLADTSAESASAYLHRLADDRAEAYGFFDSLNITYSEFFRNSFSFAHLEQLLLPGILSDAKKAGREVRVWIAGCATGQEAWSVAMLLEDLTGARGHPVPLRIIATDRSDAALALARAGIYSEASMLNVRLKHVRNYFIQEGETYTVGPRLRSFVEFFHYDLLDERSACPPASLYGDFDLILCCNLLFYYRSEPLCRILNKIRNALSQGGYFVTGEAERESVAKHSGLQKLMVPASAFIADSKKFTK